MIVKKGFIAEGTTCESCEKIIKRQALKIEGVKEVSFDFSTEKGYVTYDDKRTDLDTILYKIEEKNYTCFILEDTKKNNNSLFGWVLAITGIVVAGYFLFNLVEGIQLPSISHNMGYGLLFVAGLLTGFHCVGMCGGFVVSYTTDAAKNKRSPHTSHIMYGAGKLISYTVVGAAFGLVGSIIAFTPAMRGLAGVLAGLFLVLFGLKMLNIFPFLRRISIPTPRFVTRLIGSSKDAKPLTIGLLNGLMIACGPLQAIYIMAAGSGSMIVGAKLLFVFALGTLPVMLGFGYVTSLISNKITTKILKASGIIVIILGVIMINRGLALTGTGLDFNTLTASVGSNVLADDSVQTGGIPALKEGFQEIRMDVTRYGWKPDRFVLKKGVPVRWIINGMEINGCNNAIQVPKYGLNFDIKPGEQVIEFTPTEEGVVPWSCWMGMIPGVFIVKDDIDIDDEEVIRQELAAVPKQRAGSCGGSCGSSTCGAARGGSCGCGG